jgi:hypothetical protein
LPPGPDLKYGVGVSGIVLNIEALDEEGAVLLRRIDRQDVRVIEQGTGSKKFEAVIIDAAITPGSGQAPAALVRVLDEADADRRAHVLVPGQSDAPAG